MSLSQEELKKILVWMKFYDNIPNEYWHSLGCSYVANAIGRPMYSDVITSQWSEICEEIETTEELPTEFDLQVRMEEWSVLLLNANGNQLYVLVARFLDMLLVNA
jgi:hypothetical protein